MKQNIVFSLITIVFSIFFLFFSLKLPPSSTPGQIGAGGWPTFLLITMLILGIALLIRGIGENKKVKSSSLNSKYSDEIDSDNEKEELEVKNEHVRFASRHWFVTAILALYLFTIPLLGFLVSTFVFILLLTWLLGMKRWVYIIVTALVSSVAFTYTFVTLLMLPLPRGISIFHDLSLLFQ